MQNKNRYWHLEPQCHKATARLRQSLLQVIWNDKPKGHRGCNNWSLPLPFWRMYHLRTHTELFTGISGVTAMQTQWKSDVGIQKYKDIIGVFVKPWEQKSLALLYGGGRWTQLNFVSLPLKYNRPFTGNPNVFLHTWRRIRGKKSWYLWINK